jgi:hypothetical protein
MTIEIDLDSWEAGYADGRSGRPHQCPDNLDSFSYSSGYWVGRASRAENDGNKGGPRRLVPTQR